MKCSRRQVLVGFFGIAAYGGAMAAFGCGRRRSETASVPSLFKPAEAQTIGAALDRLLPGSLAAGALAHLEYWLRQGGYFEGVKVQLLVGAKQLDAIARNKFKVPFASCDGPKQDEALKAMQRGEAQARNFDGAACVQRLAFFALEGFLGDPKYGGNRDEVGWKFIGYKPCWWSPHKRGAHGHSDG